MFAKVFGQIFDSSIAEDYNCRRMFMDLLVLADSDGVVDMTAEAISRRTNVPLDQVTKYIGELQQPDESSRSKMEEGRRIIPIDSQRGWGWQIVNYRHYRKIRDEEARRSYFRDKQRESRKRRQSVKDTKVDKGGHCQIVASASSSASALVPTEADIYNAYPRKVGRPDALVAIVKAVKRHGATNVLERTIAYAKVRNGDLAFVPNPSTWFNQDRFLDDPETWKPNGTNQRHSTESNRSRGTANEGVSSQYRGIGKLRAKLPDAERPSP